MARPDSPPEAAPTRPSDTATTKVAPYAASHRLTDNQLRRLRTEVGRLEEQVARLEAQQAELTAELENPETYTQPGRPQHLNRELTSVVEQITAATQAWEEAAARLEQSSRERS
jgi:ATP-binding cassette subfamily F protein 3